MRWWCERADASLLAGDGVHGVELDLEILALEQGLDEVKVEHLLGVAATQATQVYEFEHCTFETKFQLHILTI